LTNHPIRILLVDDHPIVRDGLRGQLESQTDLVVVGEAASAEEALATLNRVAVEVVITDLRMPGRGGLELIRELARTHPHLRVLVLTTFDTDTEITEALAAGANGYLLKDARREAIYEAVRGIVRGRTAFAPAVSQRIAEANTTATDTGTAAALSPREIEVLRLVATGMTNRQIGSALYVGESTVKTHLQHIFRKLDAPDRAAAVAVGYGRNLL
jgi:DNA-binding NarL/FixJ family response regulator